MADVLRVENLSVEFALHHSTVEAVRDLSFTLHQSETLAVVGESGSGKSQAFLAIMGLLARNGRAAGKALLGNVDLLSMRYDELDRYRGRDIAMIFQDPMTSLNPYLTVHRQLTEVLVTHKGMSERDARKAAIAMLDRVQIPEAARRIDMHPHEFSGGMRQRVMIAMALLCQPELLIADEPTTALDVTVQAQILELIAELRRQSNMALILITHDMGVIAGLCDRVMVMYAGRVVEAAPVRELFHDPQHPYTAGLIGSVPSRNKRGEPLRQIPGMTPSLLSLPPGCAFRSRCPRAAEACLAEPGIREILPGREARCFRPLTEAAEQAA